MNTRQMMAAVNKAEELLDAVRGELDPNCKVAIELRKSLFHAGEAVINLVDGSVLRKEKD